MDGPGSTLAPVPISRRVLADDEEVLVDLRPHWVFLAGPAILTAVALAVAVTIAVEFPTAPVAVAGVLAALVAAPLLWLAARVVRWLGISLVVTTARILYRQGVFGRDLVQLRLQRVTEVHFVQTLVDRLIGSGQLVLEITGGDPMVLDDVRHPRSLQRVINRQLGELGSAGHYEGWVPGQRPVVPGPPPMDDTPSHGVLIAPPVPSTASGSAPSSPSPSSSAPSVSIPDQLIQLDDLRRRGIISDGEFAVKKTELLRRL